MCHPAEVHRTWETADGHIVIALGFSIAEIWGVFCAVINKPELIDDPRFDTPGHRTQNHAELEPILNEALSQRPTEEWIAEFEAIGLPCGPLNTIPQAAEYKQVKAREMLKEVESPRGNKLTISNTPLRLSRTPAAIRGGPPTVGQHTRNVLADLLGMSEAEVDAEFASGAAVEGQDIPASLTES